MCSSHRSGNFLVDELELEALLLRNKIADFIQDVFVKEVNRLFHKQARLCCDAHHKCIITDKEELWICHYKTAKKHLMVYKLWTKIRCVFRGLVVEVFT